MKGSVFLAALYLANLGYCQKDLDSPVVKTLSGSVRGRLVQLTNRFQAYQFSAIPYATPPVGPLRYKKTVPVKSWACEVLDATKLPNLCPQIPNMAFGGPTTQSEDCLYLNIWVPISALPAASTGRPHEPLAVYFYIHGGGFAVGGSQNPFNGTVLAALHNIIVVGIQYRIGSLGFAYFGTEDAPGNMGLWDQLEALKWVYNNIGAFGGDYNKITIGGESAGAASVTQHILSPYSRKYFRHAIAESGCAYGPWAIFPPNKAMAITNTAFDFVSSTCNLRGKNASIDAKLDCLRSIPSDVFPMVDLGAIAQNQGQNWGPVIDGDFIPRDPKVMVSAGDFSKVPLLIGVNKDEGPFFMAIVPQAAELVASEVDLKKEMDKLNHTNYITLIDSTMDFFAAVFPTTPLSRKAIHLQYWPRSHEGYGRGYEVAIAAAQSIGDSIMYYPSLTWANDTAASAPVYAYYFTYVSAQNPFPAWMGAKHTDELTYVFGVPCFPDTPSNYTRDDKFMSRVLMSYWANFVKYGNPNGLSKADGQIPKTEYYLPKWPSLMDAATGCQRSYLNISASAILFQTTNPVACDIKAQSIAFWRDFYPNLLSMA